MGDVGGLGASNNPLVQAFDKAKAAGDRESMEKAARQLNEQRLERNRAESKKDAPSGSKAAVLKAEEAAIRNNNKFETAVVVGDDGQVTLKRKGESTSVSFSRTEIENMRGQTLTHNHPILDSNSIGHSFSPADLSMLSKGRLAEIRAVTPNVEYSMSLDPKSRRAIANGKTQSSREASSTRLYNQSVKMYEYRRARLAVREGASKNLMDVWLHEHHLVSREYAKASGGAATYKVTGSKESLAELARIEQIYDGI